MSFDIVFSYQEKGEDLQSKYYPTLTKQNE